MIKVENIVKRYGNKYALNDISFSVGDGEIIGLLGPNGAGKSTTMNIITGYLSSTSGHVYIDGFEILENADEAKKLIGYVPEQPPLYMDMTVDEYLNFVFELKKCQLNRKKHLEEICEVIKISDVRSRVIGHLSKGYRQRVGIAQALIGDPKVIILDEPTVGLDPKQIIEIRNLIRTLGCNHTVILSTHILGEIQATCDRVVIINKGRIVADEKTDELTDVLKGNRRLMVKICGNVKDVQTALNGLNGVVRVETLSERELDSTTYIIESDSSIDIRKPLFNMLSDRHFPIIGMETLGMSLEDIFISLIDRSENKAASVKKKIKISRS